MTILHNSSQDETIPGQGNSCHATEAVDTLNGGNRRGDYWQDKDDNNAGVGIGIGVGPNSGGTMVIARRPFAQEVEDCWAKPHVTTKSRVLRHGKLQQELVGEVQGQITKATDESGWKMTNDDTVVSSDESRWTMTNDNIVGRL